MSKYSAVISELKSISKTNLDLSLLDYVDILNAHYWKMNQAEKIDFINYLKNNLEPLEKECFIWADSIEEISEQQVEETIHSAVFHSVEYFLEKEGFTLEKIKGYLKEVNRLVENKYRAGKIEAISYMSTEVQLFSNTQRTEYYLEKQTEYLQKLKEVTTNKHKENLFDEPYNPLMASGTLKSMLFYQHKFNKQTGYFWLPLPATHTFSFDRINDAYANIFDIVELAFEPAVELVFILNWIKNQIEPNQRTDNLEKQNPIIEDNRIRLFYEQYLEVMPKGEAEPLEDFKSRFYADACIENPLIPIQEKKQGRKGDKYSEARQWRNIMYAELKKYLNEQEKRSVKNFEIYTKNAFGVRI